MITYNNEDYIPYKNAMELIEEKDKEIERLNKRVKECEEAYLRTRKQYSELEGKYVLSENVITELEKYYDYRIEIARYNDQKEDVELFTMLKNKLKELKVSDKE